MAVRRTHALGRDGYAVCSRFGVDQVEWTVDQTGIIDCKRCLERIEAKRIVRSWGAAKSDSAL